MNYALLPHSFFPLRDGGKLRFARFEPESSARATVLIVPGRREFIEKKHYELAPALLDNGLRMIVVEPRGQGLSSRFLDGAHRQRDYVAEFSTHMSDLRAFYAHEIENQLDGPLFIHGHSMGAHLLLRWLSEDQPPVAGAFITSPMLALSSMPAHMLAHGLSWLSAHLFDQATEYAPLQHDYDDSDRAFDNNPLTNDPERFRIMADYFDSHPDMAVGGVTWGWAAAAFASMQLMHIWPYLSKIDAPVLALLGEKDKVTPAAEVAPLLKHISGVQIEMVPGAKHDLLNESLAHRAKAWQLIHDFIDARLTQPQAKSA